MKSEKDKLLPTTGAAELKRLAKEDGSFYEVFRTLGDD
jgi:hypothetical protein